ncbi:MAG: cyclic nucleotide-binding domain-containing protein, partial [Gemmatimonadetes bacterium]|nr:cyclic nucleotide-binding domain-containing protein [Gemmatimonadota bacterium]
MGTGTATEHVVEVLGRVPLFQGLPRADLERIAGLVNPRELQEGEFAFREGDPGDRFYIVHSGAVEILKERPLGDHERLAVKRAGEAFGEMSLLNDAPRSASVRAVENTRLLSVARQEFDELLGGESISVRLLRGLARALRAFDVRFAAREAGGGADTFRQFGRLVLHGLEPRSSPQVEGFQVAAATARDDSIGGSSLWDCLTTEDGRTILALMDVKGTGLPPAYLIAITRALLHEVAPETSFDDLLRRLNAATFRNLFEGLDECVEAALLEIREGTVRWSCAGDQPAVILRADGTTGEASAHGPPLGILPQFDYGVTEIALQPGDTLLAFSEAPAGLVKGALELARGRIDADAAQLARLLQSAYQQVQARGAEADL